MSSQETLPYIGSRISLISNTDVRYEGILVAIDTEKATASLRDVRAFGTEGRSANHIPPFPDTYSFVVFQGSDIKDLTVCEPEEVTEVPAAQPAASPPEASVVAPQASQLPSTAQRPPHESRANEGYPASNKPQQQHTSAVKHSSGGGYYGNSGGYYQGGGGYNAAHLSPSAHMQHHNRGGGYAGGRGSGGGGRGHNGVYGGGYDGGRGGYMGAGGYNAGPRGDQGYRSGEFNGGSAQYPARSRQSHNDYHPNSNYNTHNANSTVPVYRSSHPPPAHGNHPPRYQAYYNSQGGNPRGKKSSSMMNHGGNHPSQANNASSMAGVSSSANSITLPPNDFDFEDANAKFEKPGVNGASDSALPNLSAPLGGYNKTLSFFDNISCETLDRQRKQGQDEKVDREKQKALDVATFGDVAANFRGPKSGFRRGGRGRAGYGGGRGGRGGGGFYRGNARRFAGMA